MKPNTSKRINIFRSDRHGYLEKGREGNMNETARGDRIQNCVEFEVLTTVVMNVAIFCYIKRY
jgi:hypothetical protein